MRQSHWLPITNTTVSRQNKSAASRFAVCSRLLHTTSNLRRSHSAHLLRPPLRGGCSLRRPHFVCTVSWYADVILPFKHHLEVSIFEGRGAAEFGEFAGGADEVVNEVVCDLKEELENGR